MIDPNLLRTQIEKVKQVLARRGYHLDTNKIAQLETQRKSIQIKTQDLQKLKNQNAKAIGQKKAAGESIELLLQESSNIAGKLIQLEQNLNKIQSQLHELWLEIPNLLHESVPDGHCENENQEIRRWGQPRKFDFPIQDHVTLGEQLGWLDFEISAKLSGSRFVVMRRNLVKLQRALIHFMLDQHVRYHGYEEIYVPYIVHAECMLGTGQLPKFKAEQFELKSERESYLIPTAEVPVINTVRDSIIAPEDLPMKLVCHSPCFRSEAGSYGKDTRGMIRLHQFEKVEMVQLVRPENSYQALEEMVGHAEKLLQLLELPYRIVVLCAGDTGFSAAKTYDIEVWLPAQDTYREISSCSNTETFQARRLKSRWRNPETGKPEPIHTLNGSGLPIGRTMVAIMENYQEADGRICVPNVLKSYFDDQKYL